MNSTCRCPAERREWNAEPHAVPARTDLRPIEISQPEGPSFTVDGNQITWAATIDTQMRRNGIPAARVRVRACWNTVSPRGDEFRALEVSETV
jgi:Cu2+-containing amine oxidase